jgi:peptide/nickel transport system substrate-binding protein
MGWSDRRRWLGRWTVVGALALLLAFGAAACGGDEETAAESPPAETGTAAPSEEAPPSEEPTAPAEEPPSEGSGGPIIVNTFAPPVTLDPHGVGLCGYTDQWTEHFYPQLVSYEIMEGPDGTTQFNPDPAAATPELAESWEISPDGLTYTFHLNPNATFASGAPIDSAAVKFSYERSLSIQGCSAYFFVGGEFDNIPAIETPDPQTVIFQLQRPNLGFLHALMYPGSSIVDPEVIATQPDTPPAEEGAAATANEYWATHVAGDAGPFLLAEYEPGQRMVMRRNPNWFGEPPGADEIIVNFIGSESTLLLQARSGEADVTIGLSPQSVDSLREDPNVQVVEYTAGFFMELGLVNSKPPFDNVQLREAVSYAIPYQDILDNVYFGFGSLYYGPIPPGLPYFNEALSAAREFDLERAQQLVAESGVPTPIDVEIVIQEGNTIEEQIATIVQGTWREIGFNVTITKLGAAEYDTSTGSQATAAFFRQNGPGVLNPQWLFDYDLICGIPGLNRSDICIPEADELFFQARETTDPDELQSLYDQITELWRDQSPKIPVVANTDPVVLKPGVNFFWHLVHFMEPVSK